MLRSWRKFMGVIPQLQQSMGRSSFGPVGQFEKIEAKNGFGLFVAMAIVPLGKCDIFLKHGLTIVLNSHLS